MPVFGSGICFRVELYFNIFLHVDTVKYKVVYESFLRSSLWQKLSIVVCERWYCKGCSWISERLGLRFMGLLNSSRPTFVIMRSFSFRPRIPPASSHSANVMRTTSYIYSNDSQSVCNCVRRLRGALQRGPVLKSCVPGCLELS